MLVDAVRASSAAAHGHEHHPSQLEVLRENHATLNDIPVAEGSWQENYNKRNAKWNKMLAASVVVFTGSLYAVCTVYYSFELLLIFQRISVSFSVQ